MSCFIVSPNTVNRIKGTMSPGIYILFERKALTSPVAKQAKLLKWPDWSGEWRLRYFPDANPDCVEAYHLSGCAGTTDTPLFYFDYLANIDGAGFILFQEPGASVDTVKAAKAELRHKYDVVRIETVKIRRWIEPEPDTCPQIIKKD